MQDLVEPTLHTSGYLEEQLSKQGARELKKKSREFGVSLRQKISGLRPFMTIPLFLVPCSCAFFCISVSQCTRIRDYKEDNGLLKRRCFHFTGKFTLIEDEVTLTPSGC